ncbi:hypothetical protein NDU88_005531 [Pleurodeles waltl]|uniref:Uncharacterized protein n=1 Tax=Pleurodeles waltl TaxID=8319 RepID=A0AAV7VJ89_PLEWA|nr:hypothetical protein NDU88_005531 [Pleurodeles waltl]
MRIPDPEVLRMGTNPLTLPGDGGQQQPLHATTRIEKAEGSDLKERSDFKEEDGDRKDHGSNTNPGGDEFGERGSGGRNTRSRSEETFPRGEQGRPQDHIQHQECYRGSGGSGPKPRHALGRAWPLKGKALHRVTRTFGRAQKEFVFNAAVAGTSTRVRVPWNGGIEDKFFLRSTKGPCDRMKRFSLIGLGDG